MIVLLALISFASHAAAAKVVLYNPLDGAEGEPLWQSILPQFAQESPDLEVRQLPLEGKDLTEALNLAQQPGNAVFTIVYALRLPQLADEGVIAPLDEVTDPALWEDHYPKVVKTVTYKGKIWALPLEANPYALYCNLPMFRAAGLPLPKTWEDTLAAARALTKDFDGDGKIDQYGYTQCTYQFPLELWSYGLNIVTEDGQVDLDAPKAAEILHWYWELRHYSPPHVDFERNDVAMKISITDNLDRYRHLDFAVVPLPRGERRINSLGGSNSTLGLVMLRGSDPEAAKRFLAFWSRPEIYLRWCTWTHNLPLRRSVRESEAYHRYLLRVPEMQVFNEEFEYAIGRPCIPQYEPAHEIVARATGWCSSQDTQPTIEACQERLHQAAEEIRALFK